MDIVTVNEYSAPADHRAIIANIRTAALAAGWTVEEYRSANEVWRTNVGWSSGASPGYAQEKDISNGEMGTPLATGYSGSFLQLQSVGHGAQGALNRWRLYGFLTDHYCTIGAGYGSAYWGTDFGAMSVLTHGWPTQRSYDADNALNPACQDNKWPPPTGYHYQSDCAYRHSIFPVTGCVKQWVITYGTKLIHSIVNVDNVYYEHSMFGVLDLFDTTIPGGIFYQKSYLQANIQSPTSLYPYRQGLVTPVVYADGVYSMSYPSTFLAGLDVNLLTPTSTVYYGDLYNAIVLQNAWSGKRVIHVPIVRAQIAGLLCPVGRTWYGILNIEALTPGQILTYGSEQYQVWPVPSVTHGSKYGIAYRIA